MKRRAHFLVVSVAALCIAQTALLADALDNWHVRRLPQATNGLNAVTYANGLFVSVGWSGAAGEILTSPDGMAWTSQVVGTNNTLSGFAYGNGRSVAVGRTTYLSTNGVDWSAVFPGPTGGAICFGNGLFVCVQGYGILTSGDGVTWTSQNTPPRLYGIGIGYGNGRFVIVGSQPFTGPDRLWSSTNGVQWAAANGGGGGWDSPLQGVAWGDGLFVGVGNFESVTSGDGVNWNTENLPSSLSKGITYGDEVFVTVGPPFFSGQPAPIQTSPNGLDWLARNSGETNGLRSVASGNGTFVAVGDGGVILQSDDTRPHLSGRIDAGARAVELTVTGGLLRNYRLQAADRLPANNWIDLLTFTNTGLATNFVDTGATNFSRRFYRVVSP